MPDNTLIGRFLAARESAAARGDRGRVGEIDLELARLGYRPDATGPARDAAERAAEAEARPRRGRAPIQRSASTETT